MKNPKSGICFSQTFLETRRREREKKLLQLDKILIELLWCSRITFQDRLLWTECDQPRRPSFRRIPSIKIQLNCTDLRFSWCSWLNFDDDSLVSLNWFGWSVLRARQDSLDCFIIKLNSIHHTTIVWCLNFKFQTRTCLHAWLVCRLPNKKRRENFLPSKRQKPDQHN